MRPKRRSGEWRSVLPGILILAGLLLSSTLVFFMDMIQRGLLEGPRIVILAAEARGLAPGADVWIAGSPSGRVTDVVFGNPDGREDERVVIRAVLHWTALPYLGSGASVRVGSSALLAPVVLKLEPGAAGGEPFDPKDTLHAVPNETRERFIALATEGKQAADSLTDLLAVLAERLEWGPGTVARVRRDTALLLALPRMVASAGELSTALRSDQALPALLASDSIGPTLTRIVSGFRSLASDDRTTHIADTVAELLSAVERVSSRLARIDAELQAGNGTAGRALYDDEMRRQQRLLRARLDTVRAELIRKPWRWLRFKLF